MCTHLSTDSHTHTDTHLHTIRFTQTLTPTHSHHSYTCSHLIHIIFLCVNLQHHTFGCSSETRSQSKDSAENRCMRLPSSYGRERFISRKLIVWINLNPQTGSHLIPGWSDLRLRCRDGDESLCLSTLSRSVTIKCWETSREPKPALRHFSTG